MSLSPPVPSTPTEYQDGNSKSVERVNMSNMFLLVRICQMRTIPGEKEKKAILMYALST